MVIKIEKSEKEEIIIDSCFSLDEARTQNPGMPAPQEVLQRQELVNVQYISFDGKIHQGQIVIDRDLAGDVKKAFAFMLEQKFPITSVIPIADKKFHWNDEISMRADNSSGFNYRRIARSFEISNHGYGRALDINPKRNPYIKGDFIQPTGAIYDPSISGTITADSPIVAFFKKRGWQWGGYWSDEEGKDYQHFEKSLNN